MWRFKRSLSEKFKSCLCFHFLTSLQLLCKVGLLVWRNLPNSGNVCEVWQSKKSFLRILIIEQQRLVLAYAFCPVPCSLDSVLYPLLLLTHRLVWLLLPQMDPGVSIFHWTNNYGPLSNRSYHITTRLSFLMCCMEKVNRLNDTWLTMSTGYFPSYWGHGGGGHIMRHSVMHDLIRNDVELWVF